MKKIITTISIIIFVLFILLIWIKFKPRYIEFHKVEQFKEIDMSDTTIYETCVVVNCPKTLSDFKIELEKYISKHGKNKKIKNHCIFFIREHYRSIGNIIWGEQTEYLKTPPAEIDEIDLLAKIKWYKDSDGTIKFYTHYYTDPSRQYQLEGKKR